MTLALDWQAAAIAAHDDFEARQSAEAIRWARERHERDIAFLVEQVRDLTGLDATPVADESGEPRVALDGVLFARDSYRGAGLVIGVRQAGCVHEVWRGLDDGGGQIALGEALKGLNRCLAVPCGQCAYEARESAVAASPPPAPAPRPQTGDERLLAALRDWLEALRYELAMRG